MNMGPVLLNMEMLMVIGMLLFFELKMILTSCPLFLTDVLPCYPLYCVMFVGLEDLI